MGGALWLTSININNCNTSRLIDRFTRYLQIASLNKIIANRLFNCGVGVERVCAHWEQFVLQAKYKFH